MTNFRLKQLLQLVGEDLADLFDFRPDDDTTVGCVAVLSEVILVIAFSRVKRFKRDDLGDDRVAERFFVIETLLVGLCEFSLLVVVVED